jgi:hypothetical protein
MSTRCWRLVDPEEDLAIILHCLSISQHTNERIIWVLLDFLQICHNQGASQVTLRIDNTQVRIMHRDI